MALLQQTGLRWSFPRLYERLLMNTLQSSPRPTSPLNSGPESGPDSSTPSAGKTTSSIARAGSPPGGPKSAIRRRAAADHKETIKNARPSSTRAAGAGGSSGTMLRLYTDESPGLKVDPMVIMFLSLGFIFSVVALHCEYNYARLVEAAWVREGRMKLTICSSDREAYEEILIDYAVVAHWWFWMGRQKHRFCFADRSLCTITTRLCAGRRRSNTDVCCTTLTSLSSGPVFCSNPTEKIPGIYVQEPWQGGCH